MLKRVSVVVAAAPLRVTAADQRNLMALFRTSTSTFAQLNCPGHFLPHISARVCRDIRLDLADLAQTRNPLRPRQLQANAPSPCGLPSLRQPPTNRHSRYSALATRHSPLSVTRLSPTRPRPRTPSTSFRCKPLGSGRCLTLLRSPSDGIDSKRCSGSRIAFEDGDNPTISSCDVPGWGVPVPFLPSNTHLTPPPAERVVLGPNTTNSLCRMVYWWSHYDDDESTLHTTCVLLLRPNLKPSRSLSCTTESRNTACNVVPAVARRSRQAPVNITVTFEELRVGNRLRRTCGWTWRMGGSGLVAFHCAVVGSGVAGISRADDSSSRQRTANLDRMGQVTADDEKANSPIWRSRPGKRRFSLGVRDVAPQAITSPSQARKASPSQVQTPLGGASQSGKPVRNVSTLYHPYTLFPILAQALADLANGDASTIFLAATAGTEAFTCSSNAPLDHSFESAVSIVCGDGVEVNDTIPQLQTFYETEVGVSKNFADLLANWRILCA
ncbi:hypothetical protein C8F01DRAFT_1084782 [Mycena amicta]|nr:hypothetical protein C8F01DRAFT_1084782 [Mycena amicta]